MKIKKKFPKLMSALLAVVMMISALPIGRHLPPLLLIFLPI